MNTKLITPSGIEALKQENITFVSGVFDIFHIGHLDFFENIKRVAPDSKLLVVIHSDEIVKKIKGNDRPYMGEEERARILAHIDLIDYVMIWDGWESIVEVVELLRPKYIAITEKNYEHSKTGKWKGLGWEDVSQKVGSELIEIPIYKKFSSTKFAHLFE